MVTVRWLGTGGGEGECVGEMLKVGLTVSVGVAVELSVGVPVEV
jgi:hypothetical protein